jgi:D-glycero-D-manno-heptose 1,7-bisphosphate phosphatase
MKKLVILDRDGVINFDTNYIKSPDEWVPIPQSLEAIAALGQRGYTVVVATNQSGIGRGYFDIAALEAIHHKMRMAVASVGGSIEKIYYCPHLPTDNCTCRKPLTGMFDQIAVDFGVSLIGVPAIGDSLRDIQVAQSVHAQPMLVRTGKGAQTLETHRGLLADVACYENLWEAVMRFACYS